MPSSTNRSNTLTNLTAKPNPHRYQLSSGAELVHYIIPNMRNPSIHIWTKVGNEEYDTRTYIEYFSDIWDGLARTKLPFTSSSMKYLSHRNRSMKQKANLLGAAFELVAGGQAQVHVGTGLRWTRLLVTSVGIIKINTTK